MNARNAALREARGLRGRRSQRRRAASIPQLRDFACWGLELRHQTGRPFTEDPEVDEGRAECRA